MDREIKTLGEIVLPVIYGGHVFQQNFIVSGEINDSCILGWDAIKAHGFVLNGANKSICIGGVNSVQSFSPLSSLTLTRPVALPSWSEATCPVTVLGNLKTGLFVFSPRGNLPEGVQVDSFAMESNTDNKYLIRLRNLSSKNISLPRGFELGDVDFDFSEVCNLQESAKIKSISVQSKDKKKLEPVNTDKEYLPLVKNILHAFADLIASSDAELGQAGMIKHSIDTQGNPPIRLRPYRSARNQADEIDKHVKEMYEAGVIRNSTSPWAAPVLIVAKKGGEKRFCIDYRKLNAVTKKDSYPLPRIDDTLDSMHGMRFFTTLDLKSGYWQIELDEKSKEKTAFIVGNGLYEFNRMPFGLCNAPATFQRLMNHALRSVIGKKALVYLDDVIIYSKTQDEHMKDINEVLELIRKAGLRIQLKKCHFFRDSVNYLGHVISRKGISPDPEKIDKVKNYPVPNSVKEVRAFLGLAGYYRKFIPNFGKIAKTLCAKQTSEATSEPFDWTEDDQKAFEKLRDSLVSPPILAYPDFSKEFILFTDACDWLGAVLSQEQEKGEVVIAYASKHLKPPQLKYATIEKEAYAVIFAIKHFHHYLVGRPFTVISDHRPLQWLAQQKDDSGRLGRWAVKLAAYDYRIVYRPGRVHQNADSLSRLRVAAAQNGNVDRAERHLVAAVDSLTIDSNLGDLQRADKLCKSIINYLQHGTRAVEDIQITPLWLKEIDFYNIENGILYRRAPNLKSKRRNEENRQLVLPLALRRRVVKELHDAATAGHLTFIRTYTKVSDNYYWPDMRKDIKKYCETCEVCIANSKLNIKSPLHPIEQATRPFQIIGIDFLGPIKPCSSSGNSHIMVMTDYFSKWAEAVALPNQTAAVTADCLYSTIIQRHGPPEVIITDQGRNFVSKLLMSFALNSILSIAQRLPTILLVTARQNVLIERSSQCYEKYCKMETMQTGTKC